MISVMVTYKVKAERVDENQRLVRAVYDELETIGDPRVPYATFRKKDGQTFVHVAFFQDDEAQAVLSGTAAFRAFQDGIADRYEIPPMPEPIELVGAHSFRWPG